MQLAWSDPPVVVWCQQLLNSYAYWTKSELIQRIGTPLTQAETLFHSALVVVSHGAESDPILNYGNQIALELWEMDWESFTRTPSRLTAESMNREERSHMLARAETEGYISNYHGVRISSSGKRFRVDNAIIWTVRANNGENIGQAATFSDWQFLGD
ncbi:MAG: MEKHLA domain-containing protein [Nitrosomonas sp.]|nr:MEKHLA domain-containing protein [Nitrosomonas sp.]